eukprot:3940990-Rhodomonas_salina.2
MVCGTKTAYGAMRRAVLRQLMVVPGRRCSRQRASRLSSRLYEASLCTRRGIGLRARCKMPGIMFVHAEGPSYAIGMDSFCTERGCGGTR